MSARWIILRTSGGRTLALAASLLAAGHDVWTPARTQRRQVRAKTPSGFRQLEVDLPILPTFVFARERELETLAAIAVAPESPHPDFSVFRHGGRVPLVADCGIAGLRREEEREAATLNAIRGAETHAEAERIRIAAIKSDAARRRAERAAERNRRDVLRAQRPAIAAGSEIEVLEMPVLIGVTGVVERVDGPYVHVRFGSQSWKIEGWRVMPATLHDHMAPRGLAA